jgi:hypothetical protein
MALECGSAMHEMFGAVRVWQLSEVQKLPDHAQYTGKRLFGAGRWNKCWKHCMSHTDQREQLLELCFAILSSGGWKDDDNDRTRTMTNMELATIVYVDERFYGFENWPIYVEDEKNPQSMVGIEQVFDVTLTYEDGKEIRYIGTIDGCIIKAATNQHYLDENKTAVRLGQGWRDTFDMKHQITGYCAASTSVFGFRILKSRVTGLRIGQGSKAEDVYPFEPLERTWDSIQHWGTWVREMVETYEKYKDDFENATRYTHSCNRYFRPCSLLSFCADSPEGRQVAFSESMVDAEPSPSERAVGD